MLYHGDYKCQLTINPFLALDDICCPADRDFSHVVFSTSCFEVRFVQYRRKKSDRLMMTSRSIQDGDAGLVE